MAFDLNAQLTVRARLIDNGDEVAPLAKFAGDNGMLIRTAVDHERNTGGWAVYLDNPDFIFADSAISTLIRLRALSSNTSVEQIFTELKQHFVATGDLEAEEAAS